MRGHRMPDMKEGNVNVTPLIDIVMCLIIFYMLVARIGVDTGKIKLNLPDARVGATVNDPANTINLNVTGSGGILQVYARDGNEMREFRVERGRVDQSTLIPFLTRVRTNNAELKAIIRADKDTPYELVEPVLLACARAKIKEYQFEAKKERGVP